MAVNLEKRQLCPIAQVNQVLEVVQIPRKQVPELPQNPNCLRLDLWVRGEHTVLDGQLQEDGQLPHDGLEHFLVGGRLSALEGHWVDCRGASIG